MDIDRIIDDLNFNVDSGAKNDGPGPEAVSLEELLQADLLTDDIQYEIYNRFKAAAIDFINKWVKGPECYDVKAQNMMYCSYDVWQACVKEFGRSYFYKNKLLRDLKRERVEGGLRYRDELLLIGLDVYDSLCSQFKKVFQLYSCAQFLGASIDNMQALNTAHPRWGKNAHRAAENSLRTGALNNRGSAVGYAMLLNHDYNYTKTTEIVHTNGRPELTAASLPKIDGPVSDDL